MNAIETLTAELRNRVSFNLRNVPGDILGDIELALKKAYNLGIEAGFELGKEEGERYADGPRPF